MEEKIDIETEYIKDDEITEKELDSEYVETSEVIQEWIPTKDLYLVLDENKKVIDLSFEEGQFYQSVPEEYTAEQAIKDIGRNGLDDLYWEDGMLMYKPKSNIDKTKEELQEEIKHLTERLEEETTINRKQIILEFEKTEKMVLETLDLVLSGDL